MSESRLVELPLAKLVIGTGQVRTREVGKGLDELAASIAKIGLLQPITVCPSRDQEGMFEILAGQRRFLAHQQLQRTTIQAIVRDGDVDTTDAKIISITENMLREDPSVADYIARCTELFHIYGSLQIVSAETGLPYAKVSLYVKFDRLRPEMKQLVTDGEVELRTALKAQDAVTYAGDYDAEKAVDLARNMSKMTNPQREKAQRALEENPSATVAKAVEVAKTAETETEVRLRILPRMLEPLRTYAKDEGTTDTGAAAVKLVTEGLLDKGYLTEDE